MAAPIVTVLALARTKWSARSPAICTARALRMFLRMHAFKVRALFSFFVFIVRSIEASLHEMGPSLFFQHRHDRLILLFLSSSSSSVSTAIIHLRSHRIYLYRKALDRVSAADAPPWKLEKKLVIGCGKRNVALYLLLLLFIVVVVVVVGICMPLQGNIITTLRFVEMWPNGSGRGIVT